MTAPADRSAKRLPLRVVVLGRPFDLSDAEFDGFVTRRRALVKALSQVHDVRIALLRPSGDAACVAQVLREKVLCDQRVSGEGSTKRQRVSHLLTLLRRRSRYASAQQRVLQKVSQFDPEVIVTLGPWLDEEYAALFDRYPAVHLFEEDLTRMRELAPQSNKARAFRRVETLVRSCTLAQPRVVLVISDEELSAARRRFPRARLETLPYTLSSDDWPLPSSPSHGDAVLVVGALTEERHAEGLEEALRALSDRRPPGLRVRLVSGAGVHPMLTPYLELAWVELRSHRHDLWSAYRSARMVLVPAKRATGMKTTILQGWATGCPVVTYAGSAATLGQFMHAMMVSDDGDGIARSIAIAWNDSGLRDELARRGLDIMANSFDANRSISDFLRIVSDVATDG